jgi:hypothetical protein
MRYGGNSSSMVRAACTSAVAKPSVNRSQTDASGALASWWRPWLTLKRATLRATRSSQNRAPCSWAIWAAWLKQSSAAKTS